MTDQNPSPSPPPKRNEDSEPVLYALAVVRWGESTYVVSGVVSPDADEDE